MLLCFWVTKYDQMLVFKVINYKVWICFFMCIFVKVLLVPMGNWFLSSLKYPPVQQVPIWGERVSAASVRPHSTAPNPDFFSVKKKNRNKKLTFMNLWVINKLLLEVLFSELWSFQIESSTFRMSVLWSDTLKGGNTVSFKLGFKTVL